MRDGSVLRYVPVNRTLVCGARRREPRASPDFVGPGVHGGDAVGVAVARSVWRLLAVAAVVLSAAEAGFALMPPQVTAVNVYVGEDAATAAVELRGYTLGGLDEGAVVIVDRATGHSVPSDRDLFCRWVGPGVGERNPPPGSVQQRCRLWVSLRGLVPGRGYGIRVTARLGAPIWLPLEGGARFGQSTEQAPPDAADRFVAVEEDGRWGYRDADGVTRISPRFILARPFNAYGLAVVLHPEEGWLLVDRRGRMVLRPHVVDNGPDPYVEGLARFWENGKIGFFAPDGRVVIEPVFDFARPFHQGRAAVCRGCRLVPEGEHTEVRGGRWGFIDPFGRPVVPAELLQVGDYESGRVRVQAADGCRVLDRQGRQIARRPSATP